MSVYINVNGPSAKSKVVSIFMRMYRRINCSGCGFEKRIRFIYVVVVFSCLTDIQQ